MRISVYESKKRIGFIRLTRSGKGVNSKYTASIHIEKHNASVFKDDCALARGLTIARRCFPGGIMDIEF